MLTKKILPINKNLTKTITHQPEIINIYYKHLFRHDKFSMEYHLLN